MKSLYACFTVVLFIMITAGGFMFSGVHAEEGLMPAPNITVTIEPEEARAEGGQWMVILSPSDPGPDPSPNPWPSGWLNSGDSYILKPGEFMINFRFLPGWDPPLPLYLNVSDTDELERTGVYTPWYGDITKKGSVDVSDANLVLNHLVGLVDLTNEYGASALLRAKVSGDGEQVHVGDAILILRKVAGLISNFPV